MAALLAFASAPATADLEPAESLTYIPFGYVHNRQPSSLVRETLEDLSDYGIGQAVLPMPSFKKEGTLKLSRNELRMIPTWVAEAASLGSGETVVADFQGKIKGARLNLEEPAVRGRMVAGIETVMAMGVGGVQLDLEPYPTSPGFLFLLEEIHAAFARRGFTGRLSVTAPADTDRWSPSYLAAVTAQLNQVDPLFYDSELRSAPAYEGWVREGLAYYSANSSPGARIVPVIPSYGPDPWHEPAVENIAHATLALEQALQEGSRINGAGIFWWWAFYLEEEGKYEPAADQAAWRETLTLPFTP